MSLFCCSKKNKNQVDEVNEVKLMPSGKAFDIKEQESNVMVSSNIE